MAFQQPAFQQPAFQQPGSFGSLLSLELQKSKGGPAGPPFFHYHRFRT